MKGWIKVHNEDKELFFRAAEVRGVYPAGKYTAIKAGDMIYHAVETVDEVLDLISEAECKSLYKKLVEIHKECKYQFEKYKDCTSHCPYSSPSNDAGLCVFSDTLPRDWTLEKIPEEYR